MNKLFILFSIVLTVFVYSCTRENIEDKYLNTINQSPDTTNQDISRGEIAWFSFNGSLIDSSSNNTALMANGNIQYVNGINADHGEGLYLDGNSYLIVNIGQHDTLALAIWIKGDGTVQSPNAPVLFDYGFDRLMTHLELDGVSGATTLTLKKNDDVVNSKENPSFQYLNSYNKYSFVYVEAGGDKAKVYFKGYKSSGDEVIYFDEYDFPGVIDTQSELLYIGRTSVLGGGTESYFKGSIDEIHIYNKALSNAEIEAMALIPTN